MLQLRTIPVCFLLSVSFLSIAAAGDSAPLQKTDRQVNEQHVSNAAGGVVSETLLKTGSSWDGVPYRPYAPGQPELTVIKLTIAPHTVLPWHIHHMPNAAYVASGELLVQQPAGGQERRLGAGDVLAEMVDSVHRGRTGDKPVELIVFYAGVTGMPLSRPADCVPDCGEPAH